MHTSSNVPSNSKKDESSPKDDAGKKNEVKDSAKEGNMNGLREATNTDSTNRLNTISSPVNTDTVDLQDTGIFGSTYDDEYIGAEADLSNLETNISVSPIPTTRIHKDHPKAQIIGETLLDLPHGKKAIGTKKVFRNKRDQRGIVVRNKTRLVAQGYRQEEGVDYDEVFSPVARIEVIWLILAFASYMDFTVYQMDVKSAFLYGTIEEEVYVNQPLGFMDPKFPNRVYKVEKELYGLHQAPRACLEAELAQTKQTYGTAITKLIKKVKKLEQTLKISQSRRRPRVVLFDEEELSEDLSKQGRSLIEELDLDAKISLVPLHDLEIQEKISDDTKVLLEEEETTKLVEEPTELVKDQGSGEKGEQEVTTADTALNTASVPISTASPTPEVSTAAANLVYIRRSVEKRKDKGKAIMIEVESKRIARDAEIAKQLQEEYDKAGKKEAVAEVDTAHVIDWNDPSIIRYHAHQNRPRSVAEVRKNMLMYLKNQGGYKMKDFKGISYDDIRQIFEKVWNQVHSFVPMDSEKEVQRLKRAGQDVEAEPAKRQRTKEVSELFKSKQMKNQK
ncbi:putative ribonuclease H-like domain-containing protein [Tanacetum coccineum]|uniref:Ribonuclease H-like domain-containing protein n=1 Tax=Tanacetum coccineum TaxID=301880 RepID=A0ABQ5ED28_9ASTR